MQTTTTALQALLDLAYSVELGNEAIDRETIEAAEARALRAITGRRHLQHLVDLASNRQAS